MIRSVRSRSWGHLVGSSVAAAALALVPSAAAASRGQAPESVTHTTGGAPVTLTVSVIGDGIVVSDPEAGISCASTCSAQFPSGTFVDLGGLPVVGWGFADWSTTPSDSCATLVLRLRDCNIFLDDSIGTSVSVQATFTPLPSPPPRCTVPGLKGRTLARAKIFLRESHCGVGKVRYAFSRNVQKGRVISQNPLHGWHREQGAKVNLVVGKGRPKSRTARRNRHGTT